ncbi:MAG: reverse transcriptase domain-containing protein, partial [bacterium]
VKNLYGQKQAGKVWYDHLRDKLTKLGFTQSRFDECVFYYGKTVFLVYTDYTILVGPDEGEIEKIVRTLSKNFKVEDQGDLSDYLGVNIERRKDGKIEMTQGTMGKWKEESGNIKNNTSIQHNHTHK